MSIYNPETYDFFTAVGPQMGRVKAAFVAALDEKLAPLGVRSADYLVMVAVANGITTASSVCSLMSHDPGAMTRKIDALEERGWVRRVRSAEDRRTIKLELTAEGRKVYPKLLATAVGISNEFLRGFTKAEVRQLESLLARMLANGESMGYAQPRMKEAVQ